MESEICDQAHWASTTYGQCVSFMVMSLGLITRNLDSQILLCEYRPVFFYGLVKGGE